ncbi:MAG: PASTA domain-containing protein [Bacteroidales bacterium]|nr:PASTA domain-containing protein [Bacteroidales bacterium]MBD5258988.1 PASTA domain-containing protein [Barnesiella sp.]
MSSNKNGFVRFWHKHPVLMNFLSIAALGVLILWLVGVVFLNVWTRHGDEVQMPRVLGLNVSDATRILEDAEFSVALDSVYNNEYSPGTVIKQVPRDNSMVKRGGQAYLLYVSYSAKKAKVPEFVDGPLSSAMVNFKSRGFENLEVREVSSDHNDLVLGATYNGLELRPGMEIPVNAHIVITVAVRYEVPVESDDADMNPEDADADFIDSIFDDVEYED